MKATTKRARCFLAEQGVKLKSARRKARGIVDVASPSKGVRPIGAAPAIDTAPTIDPGPHDDNVVLPAPTAVDAVAPPEDTSPQQRAHPEPSAFEIALRASVACGFNELDTAIAAYGKKAPGDQAALNSLYGEVRKVFVSERECPEAALLLLALVTPIVEQRKPLGQDDVRKFAQQIRELDIGAGIQIRRAANGGMRFFMEGGSDITRWLPTIVYLANK